MLLASVPGMRRDSQSMPAPGEIEPACRLQIGEYFVAARLAAVQHFEER